MSKKIGKHRLTPQKMKELEGFKDVLDLVYEERPTLKKGGENTSQAFETLAYLDEEEERLRRLETIVSSAIPNLIEYPQEDYVLAELEDKCQVLKKEIIDILAKPDSTLNLNLGSIFKTIFPKD